MIDGDKLYVWTIYDHPGDAPDSYVARRWQVTGEGAPCPLYGPDDSMTEPELATLQKYMEAAGLHCMPREPADDPVIVESWI